MDVSESPIAYHFRGFQQICRTFAGVQLTYEQHHKRIRWQGIMLQERAPVGGSISGRFGQPLFIHGERAMEKRRIGYAKPPVKFPIRIAHCKKCIDRSEGERQQYLTPQFLPRTARRRSGLSLM